MLEVVILAAGRGSRLGERTKTLPKAMVPVRYEPLLGRHLRQLREDGFQRIHVVCGYLRDVISGYVKREFPVCNIVEQESTPGTAADGLLAIKPIVQGDFLVVHGDHFFSKSPFARLESAHAAGEITFLIEEQELQIGAEKYDERCWHHRTTGEVKYLPPDTGTEWEHRRLIDGCMVLPQNICELIESARIDSLANNEMRDVFKYIARRELAQMQAIPLEGWWANINDEETLGMVWRKLRR